MGAVAFDTLKFSKRLVEAGFTDRQAEALAEEQAALIDDRLATKQDIAEVKRDIKALEVATKRDIAEVKRDIKEMETGLRRDMKEMETRLQGEIVTVKRDIHESEQRVIIRLGSMVVVAVGVVAALVKLL